MSLSNQIAEHEATLGDRPADPWRARCWQTGLRDSVAWWVFSKVAHRDVAQTARKHYEFGRDATETRWVFGDTGTATETQIGAVRRD